MEEIALFSIHKWWTQGTEDEDDEELKENDPATDTNKNLNRSSLESCGSRSSMGKWDEEPGRSGSIGEPDDTVILEEKRENGLEDDGTLTKLSDARNQPRTPCTCT